MNYQESTQILEKIKTAKKILVNCHQKPDPDSVGSALSLYQALRKLGKDVEIISPDKPLGDTAFLPYWEEIKKIDFRTFNFKAYDLFIVLDSSSPGMAVGRKDEKFFPRLPVIVIDHHTTNNNFGEINLVDSGTTSTAEIIYLLLQDWGIEIDKAVATTLLTGIIADTGVFAYSGVGQKTLEIAGRLINAGADKDEIVKNVYRTISLDEIKVWGEILGRMEIDAKYHFVWAALPHDVFAKYSKPKTAKEMSANLFAPVVKNTNFGIIMIEEETGLLGISLRSRAGFDVSQIAVKLGGGGHKAAAGAKISGLNFDEAVIKVLEIARKVADENQA